jgi:hypothetical protein
METAVAIYKQGQTNLPEVVFLLFDSMISEKLPPSTHADKNLHLFPPKKISAEEKMENSKIQDQSRTKKRFWQTHIRVWTKSGPSQNEYCRRNKLRPNRFCYWKKQIER